MLPQNINYIRRNKGYTQTKFGEILGVTRNVVGTYESTTNPPLEILLLISEKFNVTVDDLLKKDLSAKNEKVEEEKEDYNLQENINEKYMLLLEKYANLHEEHKTLKEENERLKKSTPINYKS